MQGEDIQDQHRAVDHADVSKHLFKIADLRGRKLAVKHGKLHLVYRTVIAKLCSLAAAEIRAHVGGFFILYQSKNGFSAGGFKQSAQLLKAGVCLLLALLARDHADKRGAHAGGKLGILHKCSFA